MKNNICIKSCSVVLKINAKIKSDFYLHLCNYFLFLIIFNFRLNSLTNELSARKLAPSKIESKDQKIVAEKTEKAIGNLKHNFQNNL